MEDLEKYLIINNLNKDYCNELINKINDKKFEKLWTKYKHR